VLIGGIDEDINNCISKILDIIIQKTENKKNAL